MKEEISFSSFCDAFQRIRKDNFSYDGLKALFEYLESYEEDTQQEIELDVIALCCEYCEYKNLEEYLNYYGNEHSKREEYEDEEEFKQVIEEEISNKATLIKISNDLDEGFIISTY